MNPVTYDILTQRIKQLGNLPAMPAILSRLCETLSRKSNQIDVEKVVEQISYKTTVGKEMFWRHALGTALVAQGLGHELGVKGAEEIYLAGLLHDIGILVNGVLFAEEFGDVLEEAKQKKVPVEEVEKSILGFSHAESGRILAELWRLPVDLSEVIEYHCQPRDQKPPSDITLLVHVADLASQKLGMGYGYELASDDASSLTRIWEPLCSRFPMAQAFNEETYSHLLIHLVSEADILADHVFTPAMATKRDLHCDSHSR